MRSTSSDDAESIVHVSISSTTSRTTTPGPGSRYTPKRPHRKSRGGCALCKRRKIKCDEQHPQCTPCKKRRIQCSFTSGAEQDIVTQLSNPPNELRPPCGLNSTDLHLMHHFATSTAPTLAINRPGMELLLRQEIAHLAFQYDYLMHTLLSISSLHIQFLAPSNPLHNPKAVMLHHLNAISGFRSALTTLSPVTASPILMTSLFLLFIGANDSSRSSTGEQYINSWLGLHTGIRAIIDAVSWSSVQSLPIGPVFSRGAEPALLAVRLPPSLWTMMSTWDRQDPDSEVLTRALLALGTLYALLLHRGHSHPDLFLKATSWPASLPPDFPVLTRQQRPEALVILAYYLSFSKLVNMGIWYTEEISRRGVRAIAEILNAEMGEGGKWKEIMGLPMQILLLRDPKEMEDLLLAELSREDGEVAGSIVYELPSGNPRFNQDTVLQVRPVEPRVEEEQGSLP